MAENGNPKPAGETSTQTSAPHAGSEDHSSAAVDAARAGMARAAHSAADMGREGAQYYVRQPAGDLFSLLRDYAREKPDVAAVWCFGVGLIVGWKLKP